MTMHSMWCRDVDPRQHTRCECGGGGLTVTVSDCIGRKMLTVAHVAQNDTMRICFITRITNALTKSCTVSELHFPDRILHNACTVHHLIKGRRALSIDNCTVKQLKRVKLPI